MQPKSPRSAAGITVVELMFALAIVAILAGFTGNAISAAINAAHTSAGLASLMAAVTSARSAAATGVKDVILCPSTDANFCTGGDHWENGWIAFQPLHAGSERESGDPILLRQGPFPPKVHLVSTVDRTRIRFQADGGNAGSNVTFTFCDGRGPRAAQAYALSNLGKLRAVTPEQKNVMDACGT